MAVDQFATTTLIDYHSKAGYDLRRGVRESAVSYTLEDLQVFYHIACMGNWKEVVTEQMAHLTAAGLGRPKSFVLGTSDDVAWLRQFDLDIVGSAPDFHNYETPTLAALDVWCEEHPSGVVMYLHTKGVSAPHDSCKGAWRRVMMHYIVTGWQHNLQLLQSADMVGVNWQHNPQHPHYSGNFWMARADWINSLDSVSSYRERGGPHIAGNPWARMHAELWLGSKPWHHMVSLLCENENFWSGSRVHTHWNNIKGELAPHIKQPADTTLRVTLLTFCSRPQLLPCVAASVTSAQVPDGVDLRWLVKMNRPERMQFCDHLRIWDDTLRSLSKTWVLILSDDNLLHPEFVSSLVAHVRENPVVKMIHFRQEVNHGHFRAAGLSHLTGGHVDGGQIAFDADYYNSFGWSYSEFGEEGNLFRRIHDADPTVCSFVDKALTYHDRIRWL